MERHDLIVRPIVTEKSTALREAANQYCFVVHPDANRVEVRKAIEETLKVKVDKVHILNVRGKLKRMGKFVGRRASWKKAIVTLKKGEKLNLLEG